MLATLERQSDTSQKQSRDHNKVT